MKAPSLSLKEHSFEGVSDAIQNLLVEAKKVALRAYAPHSGFHVGASVLLENGEVITGSNQENASFPEGLCAERVAIHYTKSTYPNTTIKAVAIYADMSLVGNKYPAFPCGGCRQVLLEAEKRNTSAIPLFLMNEGDVIWECESLSYLLPFHFDDAAFSGKNQG